MTDGLRCRRHIGHAGKNRRRSPSAVAGKQSVPRSTSTFCPVNRLRRRYSANRALFSFARYSAKKRSRMSAAIRHRTSSAGFLSNSAPAIFCSGGGNPSGGGVILTPMPEHGIFQSAAFQIKSPFCQNAADLFAAHIYIVDPFDLGGAFCQRLLPPARRPPRRRW